MLLTSATPQDPFRRIGKAERPQLWIGRRYRENLNGGYTLIGGCGKERVMIEIDPDLTRAEEDGAALETLKRLHAEIRDAARRKWDAGEAEPAYHPVSKQVRHFSISIAADDLR